MQNLKVVSQEEWLKERKALLAQEKAFTKEKDRLAMLRQELPVVEVADYCFHAEDGEKDLNDLFGTHRQLIVYHFMFGPDWEEGCKSCSFWADSFNGIAVHLAARDTGFVCVSNASLGKILSYKKRLGWTFDWVSAEKSRFSYDFGVTFDDKDSQGEGYNYSGGIPGGELPGVSVFLKGDDGTIYHSYSTYSRGLDILNSAYQFLDLTPMGRHEEDLSHPMEWVQRNDQY